ncbi:MAG: hypothetical protein AB7O62_25140 [Pirellulales bacterium]
MSRFSWACALIVGLFPACACAQPQPWILPAMSSADLAAVQELEQRVTLQWQNVPLEEAVLDVRRRYGVTLHLDRQRLEDIGISTNQTISVDAHDVRLKHALRRALREFEATFIVQDGAIVITSEEASDTVLPVTVYDVTGLVHRGSEHSDYCWLPEVITTAIEPQSWDDVGGPGTIEEFFFPDRDRCLIVVSQTLENHEKVTQLLQRLWDIYEVSPRQSPSRAVSDRSSHASRSPAAKAASAASASKAYTNSRRSSGRGPRRYAEVPSWAAPALHD